MTIPDANAIYPNSAIKEVVFIKNVIKSPNIEIGDYTYYDDPVNPTDFGSLSKRTDAKILIIIFKLLDEGLIVFLF
ncbi:hypothetical protein [Ligilactobacillus salivarius]|uniref:Uncharacterized protein n=1 Tax=Ligilactobacillus salivarius TaxID=1624 RepID=A0A9X6S2K4_9LACO|nr:hypothetical protein [Ligilactobacillus salivarius]PAY25968.1 hypothetical protein A8C49_11280 [Ligilactobacillus salivarius]PAY31980.1 hypothetical protein A8C50_11250 [Ligilactobacillus salivarius]PAY43494.1 hypothetical protein A8C52_11270 [Ligilactobacillus salivarius]